MTTTTHYYSPIISSSLPTSPGSTTNSMNDFHIFCKCPSISLIRATQLQSSLKKFRGALKLTSVKVDMPYNLWNRYTLPSQERNFTRGKPPSVLKQWLQAHGATTKDIQYLQVIINIIFRDIYYNLWRAYNQVLRDKEVSLAHRAWKIYGLHKRELAANRGKFISDMTTGTARRRVDTDEDASTNT